MTWSPTSTVVSDWGRPRVVIGGVDVSFYRDVPAQIDKCSWGEPFGPAAVVIKFPQITPFEPLPSWLYDMADVTITFIAPDGSEAAPPWEGYWVSEEDTISEKSNDFEIHCVGAAFQLDNYRKTPEMRRYANTENDLKRLLDAQFESTQRPALRTLPLITPGWTGITYGQKGAWDHVLTGYVQELLAMATSSGLPLPGEPIVGITAKPGGGGYWLVGSEGSVLPFGSARYFGSMAGSRLTKPSSGIAAHPTQGYWFGARDGGVFTFSYVADFHGSLGATAIPHEIEGLEAMPDGNGYVMVSEIGEVYNFGSSPYEGGVPTLTGFDKIVDIMITPSGAGYWLVSLFGYVYAYGDATYYGGVNDNAKRFVAGAARADGTGYWLLQDNGTLYNFGAAAALGPAAVSVKASDVAAVGNTGVLVVDEPGGVYALGTATYYGGVPDGGGADSQWTIDLQRGRQPILKVKDQWTTHWTVTVGTNGITHTLARDLTMAPNAYFGEGVDPDGCIWRNTRYPNFNPNTIPVFGGTTLTIGSTLPDVRVWEQQMYDAGYTDIVVDGVFSQRDSNICRWMQHFAGLVETGTVNAQTWAATFNTGSFAGDLTSAYFAPLAEVSAVDPYIYNARGDVLGASPTFDRTVMRVETYDNYGAQVTKWEGQNSAQARLNRDYPATYAGTIKLRTDPQEGSRFNIRAGQNILLKSHRGVDELYHIAAAEQDWSDLSVTLTVDQKARDLVTLAAFRQRLRDVANPSGKQEMKYRNSKAVEDRRVVWDCESGAGTLPRMATNSTQWNVVRVAFGESGSVVSTDFTVETPARFAVGVFDRYVAPTLLSSFGPSPLDDGYWDGEEWNPYGLIMGWGGVGQAGGYWPGSESDGDALTGRLVDDASWYYECATPPWLWVAVWVEAPSLNYISGQFRPGVFDG